jgi:transcriptional regulator GlxA family with amidase domain
LLKGKIAILMKDIALLAYPGCMGTELFALADLLLIANHMADALEPGRHEPFRVRLAAIRAGEVPLAGGMRVLAGRLPARTDLLVVPGLEVSRSGQWGGRLAPLRPELDALARRHQRALPLAAVCVGSFLLAEAGALDGRRATTAWPFAREFGQRYPQVKLDARAVLAEDGHCITTGAVSSVFDLGLLLVGRHMGAKVARATGRLALVPGVRATQQPFVDPALLGAAAPPFSARVNGWLSARLARPYDLAGLAEAMHVSSRTMLRRYAQETGQSPLAWLQQARVEKARALLERSRLSIGQVVDAVGYQDIPTFSRLFVRLVGQTPAQYRRAHAAPPRPVRSPA